MTLLKNANGTAGLTFGSIDGGLPIPAARYFGAYSAHGAIEQAAVDAAELGVGVRVAGTWTLATEAVIGVDSVEIDCTGATIEQTTYGLPAFKIDGCDGTTVKGGLFVNNVTKTVISGPLYENYPPRNRAAAIYLANSSNCTIQGISVRGFVSAIFGRGNTSSDAILDRGHQILGVRVDDCDFGFLGVQQDGLVVDDMTVTDVSQSQGIDPHAVYCAGSVGRNKDLTISNITVKGCPSSMVKLRYVDGLTMSNVVGDDCGRGLDGDQIFDGAISNVSVRSIQPTLTDSGAAAFKFIDCRRLTFSNSRADLPAGFNNPGVWILTDNPLVSTSTDVTVENVTVRVAYDAASLVSQGTGFRMQGVTRGHFKNCKYIYAGTDDKYAFGFQYVSVDGGTFRPCADCSLENPIVSGTQKIVTVNPGSSTTDQKCLRTRLRIDRELCLDDVAATSISDAGIDTRGGFFALARALKTGLVVRSPGSSFGNVTVDTLAAGWVMVDADEQLIDGIFWNVSTLGDASSVLTCGIYVPRTSRTSVTFDRVAKSAAVSSTTTGTKTAAISLPGSDVRLSRGPHLVVLEATGHSATAPIVVSAIGGDRITLQGTTELFSSTQGGLNTTALATAAGLPTSFDPDLSSGNRGARPAVHLRAA
jgi:hypothetical protein